MATQPQVDPGQNGFSAQDIQDLVQIAAMLPKGDPRAAKISAALHANAQATGALPTPGYQEPSTGSLYGDALFNPVGSGAHPQGVVGGAEQVGGRALQAITAPVLHPLQTVEGLSSLANEISPFGDHSQPGPIQSRINEFGQEWHKSPALALENAVGDAGGAVEGGRFTSAAVGKIAPTAIGSAARYLQKAGVPESLYESALKPSTTLSQTERANMVQTGLENELPVSKQGVKDIGTAIENLNQAARDTIATDPDHPISPLPALKNLQSVRAKFQTQVNPTADVQAVDAAGQEFANQLNDGKIGPNPQRDLTAAEAQAMKQGTYRALGSKAYGEVKGPSIEAQKALARGLKEEIETQFPEIKNLNGQQAKLLDLQPVLERAVNRSANHQIIGIGTPIAGTAAEALSGSTSAGTVAMVLKATLDNPVVKSRLAIALSKAAKIPFGQASARVQAYSSTLGSYVGATQATLGGQSSAQ